MSAPNQNQAKELGHEGKVMATGTASDNGLSRMVTRRLKIHETSEGIGSRIRRCIGNRAVRCLPPFVICEQFRMDETGRPPHPARGAQRITYVLSGKVRLSYASNNNIELGSGDLTSLMVGKGVIRSIEAVPNEEDKKDHTKEKRATASGIQLFIDVPESFKRIEPSHLNLCHGDIVSFSPTLGCQISILTGSVFGKKAPQMLTATPALILDCSLRPGSTVDIPVRLTWNAFAYIIDGSCTVQTEQARKHYYVEFMRSLKLDEESENDQGSGNKDDEEKEGFVTLTVGDDAKHEARILFCAANPLSQPIYRQGPFVDVSMNWIHQAFDDYSSRKNGFESRKWNLARRQPVKTSSRTSLSSRNSPSWTTPKEESSRKSNEDENCSASTGKSCDTKHPKNGSEDATSDTYNPCDDSISEMDDCGQEHKQASKSTFPNAFPPGSVNPASHSFAFNGDEGVEEQQKQKLPSGPNPLRDRKRHRDADSPGDENSDEPQARSPAKKK